jgi:DNA-binding response OmpR family regulator
MLNPTSPPESPQLPKHILYVDSDLSGAHLVERLRQTYHVTSVDTDESGLQQLSASTPHLLVTDLYSSGVELCRAAKRIDPAPGVLITGTEVELVPEALEAGCDGVLLKPFAPNLLYARIARLLRIQTEQRALRADRHFGKSAYFKERAAMLAAGTNRPCPATDCPYCSHQGSISFEFASYRRAWFACLSCKNVWIGKRQE